MPSSFSISDLLPVFFDRAINEITGKPLLPIEHDAVWVAILNSVRWSFLRSDEMPHIAERGTDPAIHTADRFSTGKLSRDEIVERILHSSGLDRALSQFALSLVELRLDFLLATNAEHIVSIESLGRVSADFADEEVPSPLPDSRKGGEWPLDICRKIQTAISEAEESPWMHLVQELEAIVTFRKPVPYEIQLSRELVSFASTRQPDYSELHLMEEKRFRRSTANIDQSIVGVTVRSAPAIPEEGESNVEA
jgi:hypothetical protein